MPSRSRAAACWRSACVASRATSARATSWPSAARTATEFARGLINYGSDDLRRIAGQPKERIVEILGHRPYDEVVHRDNLTLVH